MSRKYASPPSHSVHLWWSYFRPNKLHIWLATCHVPASVENYLTFSNSPTANSTITEHRRCNFFARYIKMLTTSEAPTYIENPFDVSNRGYRFRPPTPETDSIRRFQSKSPSFQIRPHAYVDHGPGYFPKRSRNRCEEVST